MAIEETEESHIEDTLIEHRHGILAGGDDPAHGRSVSRFKILGHRRGQLTLQTRRHEVDVTYDHHRATEAFAQALPFLILGRSEELDAERGIVVGSRLEYTNRGFSRRTERSDQVREEHPTHPHRATQHQRRCRPGCGPNAVTQYSNGL